MIMSLERNPEVKGMPLREIRDISLGVEMWDRLNDHEFGETVCL